MNDRKQMFQAMCDECGEKCEVPFKPTSGKPVLCSSCFGQQGNKHQTSPGGRSHGRSGDRQMHTAVCDKCGGKAEVPFKPTGDKPIYCSNCFKSDRSRGRHGGGDKRGRGDQMSEQIRSLNNKMDRIISLLESGTPKKESPKKETVKKPAAKKTVKKAVKKVVKKVAKKTAKKKK